MASPDEADVVVVVRCWDPARHRQPQQFRDLARLVDDVRPELLCVLGIPRHQAKKLVQQSWSLDYYVSKEPRSITEARAGDRSGRGRPPVISVAFSKYPPSLEEWFPLQGLDAATIDVAPIQASAHVELGATRGTLEALDHAAPDADQPGARRSDTGRGEVVPHAHVVEVCVPLNAWKRRASPLELLEHYELTYEEVSTITLVMANNAAELASLRKAFRPDTVQNSVVFAAPGETHPNVIHQLTWWRAHEQGDPEGTLLLYSCLGEREPA